MMILKLMKTQFICSQYFQNNQISFKIVSISETLGCIKSEPVLFFTSWSSKAIEFALLQAVNFFL